MKKLILVYLLLAKFSLNAQVVQHYSQNFEAIDISEFSYANSANNTWKIASCAGNGLTEAGSNALYISKGGTEAGCGEDGTDQFAYLQAPPSGVDFLTVWKAVDGKCSNNHSVTFDYKLNPTSSNVVASIVYSTNNGAFWFSQDTLPFVTDWTQITIPLSTQTNNVEFLVGIRYWYNSDVADGNPLAIDNFSIDGRLANAYIPEDSIALCGTTSTVLEAQSFITGTGMWSLLSGQGNIQNPSGNQTAINNLGIGENIFLWSVTSQVCGNSTDTVRIWSSVAPSPVNLQDTLFACSVVDLQISTTPIISGTGMWQAIDGGVITSPTEVVTTYSDIPNGWSRIVWTVSSPGCPSNSDTMNVFKVGGQVILNPDTSFCHGEVESILLHSTAIDSFQSASWVTAMGAGVLHTTSNDNEMQVSNLSIGLNYIVYSVTNVWCPTESDTIKINVLHCEEFNPIFPTVITPNGDGKNDVFMVQNLELAYPNCKMSIFNRWGDIVFESIGYKVPWDGRKGGEKLPMGTYFFKLELNDQTNSIYKGEISVIH